MSALLDGDATGLISVSNGSHNKKGKTEMNSPDDEGSPLQREMDSVICKYYESKSTVSDQIFTPVYHLQTSFPFPEGSL